MGIVLRVGTFCPVLTVLYYCSAVCHLEQKEFVSTLASTLARVLYTPALEYKSYRKALLRLNDFGKLGY